MLVLQQHGSMSSGGEPVSLFRLAITWLNRYAPVTTWLLNLFLQVFTWKQNLLIW